MNVCTVIAIGPRTVNVQWRWVVEYTLPMQDRVLQKNLLHHLVLGQVLVWTMVCPIPMAARSMGIGRISSALTDEPPLWNYTALAEKQVIRLAKT
jgi:hypothetical protein